MNQHILDAVNFPDQLSAHGFGRVVAFGDRRFLVDEDMHVHQHFDADPPLPDDAVEAAGFYFAEIWREAFGGEYLWADDRGALAIRKGTISVFPVEKVARVLREKTAGALEAYAFIYAKKTSFE